MEDGKAMMVRVSTELEFGADRVWTLLKRTETLLFVTGGLLGLPDAKRWPVEWREGEEASSRLLFLHLIPAWQHSIRVVRVDEDRRELLTHERGGPIETWNHRLSVEPLADGRSRYTDEIEVGAGPLTPLVWILANLFYRYRQSRWHALAKVIV